MSSIGPKPGVSTGQPIEVSGIRPVSAAEQQQAAAAARPAAPAPVQTVAPREAASTLVSATALDAGQVPVDSNRVSQIRKAIQTGSYPILPARISDAMIAAGLLLQESK